MPCFMIVSWLGGWLVGWFDWLLGGLVVGWSVECYFFGGKLWTWLVDELDGWLVGCYFNLVDWLVGR